MGDITTGDGYAVCSIDDLGEGPGFRKIRQGLEVREFGVNAIVLPPGFDTGHHFHERQEELYIVLSGELEIRFGDGSAHRLAQGGLARVDPATHRAVKNTGDVDAIYVIVGGKGGYVGRDGRQPEDEASPRGSASSPAA
jgi:mannose-6-phosphate isomerase-like protein (cupin superfamily)